MSLWYRLYKLGFVSGLFMALPIAIGTAWYAWSAFASLDRNRRISDPKRAIDAELFHIALHDELVRDVERLKLAERPTRNALPTMSLALSRGSLDELYAPAGKGAEPAYVKGHLEHDGKVHDVKVRLRGEQPWHLLGTQKSLKVRLDPGDLVDGVRVFNLLNDPTPFGLEDQLILDLARDLDLLTPKYHPVRLRLNNADLGVYRFEQQPDETLVRANGRIPGNMYSGDGEERDPVTGAGAVFADATGWQKIASRSPEHERDTSELDQLLEAINRSTHGGFWSYATRSLDLQRFARFDALDVVFGGSEHDWFSNHKLYADPYRGTLEPVAWSFRGFQNDESFNVVDHPLLIRLKMLPGWMAERDRAVYTLLTGAASPPAIRERADRAMVAMAEELAADPYWDAYKQLPRVSRFHRFLPRPMSLERWTLASAYELDGYATRSRWLLDALEEPGLDASRTDLTSEPDRFVSKIELVVRGHAAYSVESLRTSAECKGTATLFADADLDGTFDAAKDALVAEAPIGEGADVGAYRTLTAMMELVPHPDPSPKRGYVRIEPRPQRHTYFLVSAPCAPAKVALVLESLVTKATRRIELWRGAKDEAPETLAASAPLDELPKLSVGQRSAHPWSFPQPSPPRTIALGPGRVEVPSTRVFGAHETVELAAGTTLALGPGASIVFHGPVFARGTQASPIVVTRLDPAKPFGSLALQGPATAGARLVGVRVDGGSRGHVGSIQYTGVVAIHDTSDVVLEDWVVTNTVDAEDVVHGYQVEGLALHELSIDRAPVDAVDLEFVQGELRGLRLVGAGDDGLDLMGSKVLLQDSLIEGAKNNGVSAGEETVLTANGVVIARVKTGVLAKNASEARLLRSLVWRAERGLRARSSEERYGGKSRIGASEVFVVGAEVLDDATKGSVIELEDVHTELPTNGALEHVRTNVLQLRDWSEAIDYLATLSGGDR
ncbi:CotH kinase family protein [Myxococcota bacterium]|nr:CotH kinase family protein [Myxococcota bacterium]